MVAGSNVPPGTGWENAKGTVRSAKNMQQSKQKNILNDGLRLFMCLSSWFQVYPEEDAGRLLRLY
jgi:hypothetical protein